MWLALHVRTRDHRYGAGPPKRPEGGTHSAEPPLFCTQWGSKDSAAHSISIPSINENDYSQM